MLAGLQAHGVDHATAERLAHLPPVSILFAAFLGYNPIQHLLGNSVLIHLPAHTQSVLAGRTFFPQLISDPFRSGLHEAFAFAIVACIVAAVASWWRGGRYVDADEPGQDATRRQAWTPGGSVPGTPAEPAPKKELPAGQPAK